MIKNGILILIAVIYSASLFAQPRTLLSGKVVSTDKSVIDFCYCISKRYTVWMYYQRTRHLPFTRTGRKIYADYSAVGFETYEKSDRNRTKRA